MAASRRVDEGRFSGNPFLVFGARPRREARIRAYVRRRHMRGSTLGEILADDRIDQLGGRTLYWHAIVTPRAIRDLADDAFKETKMLHALVRQNRPLTGP